MRPRRPQDVSRRAGSAKRFGRRAALRVLGGGLGGAAAALSAPARLALAAAAGSGAARPADGPLPLWRPLATGTVPQSFTPDEFRILEQVVERILPATDTPGAAGAGVHWYLDQAAQVEDSTLRTLKEGLARLEGRATAAHGRGFASLEPSAQEDVLLAMEGGRAAEETRKAGYDAIEDAEKPTPPAPPATKEDRAFFEFVKGRVIDAYYKSEVGQIGELEWVGHEFHDSFVGRCPHPDPLVHPRPRWPGLGPDPQPSRSAALAERAAQRWGGSGGEPTAVETIGGVPPLR